MNLDLSFVDDRVRVFQRMNNLFLPFDFHPSHWTVICGRGRNCYNHGKCKVNTNTRTYFHLSFQAPKSLFTIFKLIDLVGNRRFRILCEINVRKYETAKTKMEKSVIVMSIMDTVREGASGTSAFVKQVRVAIGREASGKGP